MKVDADRVIKLLGEIDDLKRQKRELKTELTSAQSRWRSQNHKLRRFTAGLNSRIHDMEKTFDAAELREMQEYQLLKELAADLKLA